MNRLVIPRSACQANSLSPGPVAAQADLGVAAAVDVARVDEPADERAVRELDAEHLGAGVGVGVEVHDADRAVRGGAGAHRRLGDRVVAAEHDRHDAGREHLRRRSPRSRRASAPGRRGSPARRRSRRTRSSANASTFDLEMRAGRAARAADRARREPRARAVGHEVVHRRADDRDVEARELRRVLGVAARRRT